jgi:hypothetical protein
MEGNVIVSETLSTRFVFDPNIRIYNPVTNKLLLWQVYTVSGNRFRLNRHLIDTKLGLLTYTAVTLLRPPKKQLYNDHY